MAEPGQWVCHRGWYFGDSKSPLAVEQDRRLLSCESYRTRAVLRTCDIGHTALALCRESVEGFVALTMPNLELISHDWRASAACRNTDPDLFFPVGTTGPAIGQIAAAKNVCDSCDARVDCLDFALVTNQDSGVWGGTSEEERRVIRRRKAAERKAARAAAAAAAAN